MHTCQCMKTFNNAYTVMRILWRRYSNDTCVGRYWMYAAVKAGPKGLLISNDEMRDHMFQLLAPRFFHKWKQRHQASSVFCHMHACMFVACQKVMLLQRKQASDVAAYMCLSTCPWLSGNYVQKCCCTAWQWQEGEYVAVCASMCWP